MTEEQKNLLDAFVTRFKTKGKRTNFITYGLPIFFDYCNEYKIHMLHLRPSQAQEFQTYLMTYTLKNGNLRFKKGTVKNIIIVLTAFYKYLVKKKISPGNPFTHISPVKRDDTLPNHVLDENQMEKLLAYFRNFTNAGDLRDIKSMYRAHVVAELVYSTGMRIHEVIGLKEDDIDFARGTVHIRDQKTKTERTGILNEYAKGVLYLYVTKMRPFVMSGKKNGDKTLLFGSSSFLRTWFNTHLAAASGTLGFTKLISHSFRHAVGYHLLRAGCDMRYIQEILGHKCLRATQIYTKVDKSKLQNVLDRYHPRVFREKS